jgi:hypothetical protein
MSYLRRRSGRQRPESAELYQALRKHVLESVPDNFPEELREAPILALLWENRFAEGVGTPLGSADGHVAMYRSNGGGTMGNLDFAGRDGSEHEVAGDGRYVSAAIAGRP